MPALRCSMCGLQLPVHVQEENCPVCDEPLGYFNEEEPTEGWQYIIGDHLRKRVAPEDRYIPIIELEPPSPAWKFVSHEDLLEAGHKNLCDFDVVPINGLFYELQAYLDAPDVWWIEEIDPTKEVEDAGQILEGVGETSGEGLGRDTERPVGE